MREIKFRAWNKKRKTFIAGDERLSIDLGGDLIFRGDLISGEAIADKNDVEIMQYTGLKDKNGKEIFEGDILHNDDGYHCGQIKFDECSYKLCRKGRDYLLTMEMANDCSVIGSIYENPELLK